MLPAGRGAHPLKPQHLKYIHSVHSTLVLTIRDCNEGEGTERERERYAEGGGRLVIESMGFVVTVQVSAAVLS